MPTTSLLNVENLCISFPSKTNKNNVVHDVSFCLKSNEILGIVGESGSSKTIVSLSILGLLNKNALVEGSIKFEKEELTNISEKQFQKIRGNKISMIFQEPMSSLNPSMTCGKQVLEILLQHTLLSKKDAKSEVIHLFEKVKLQRPKEIYNLYPHQISGGQKQRVMITMAIACKPNILIADEPTTALDVVVQKEIIKLLKELQQDTKMSILFISHDLSLISEICDRVVVMYKGGIVEQKTTSILFSNPQKNYTKALILSKPNISKRLKKLPLIKDFIENTVKKDSYSTEERNLFHKKLYSQKPLLEINHLKKYFLRNKVWWFQKNKFLKAVDGVSFKLYEGETLGLVGESGCGKTTLGRAIVNLEKITSGSILYQGKDLKNLSFSEKKTLRKDIQIIFQDPFSSLNPRIIVGKAILEPMKVHHIYKNDKDRKRRVFSILEKVGLSPDHYHRYPHELSGGQRQRIAIARVIALQPKIIICDESVSALDVSAQAQVLNLLNDLKTDFGFTYIFISHDLSVVKHMSDQLAIMYQGRIEEIREADLIYKNPNSVYTQKLIDSIPKGNIKS